jgi:S-adenosylmethionine:diacylglycerol 3-amino-3-carboxypropyl transferase
MLAVALVATSVGCNVVAYPTSPVKVVFSAVVMNNANRVMNMYTVRMLRELWRQ